MSIPTSACSVFFQVYFTKLWEETDRDLLLPSPNNDIGTIRPLLPFFTTQKRVCGCVCVCVCVCVCLLVLPLDVCNACVYIYMHLCMCMYACVCTKSQQDIHPTPPTDPAPARPPLLLSNHLMIIYWEIPPAHHQPTNNPPTPSLPDDQQTSDLLFLLQPTFPAKTLHQPTGRPAAFHPSTIDFFFCLVYSFTTIFVLLFSYFFSLFFYYLTHISNSNYGLTLL